VAEKYLTAENRIVGHRIQVKEEKMEKAGKEDDAERLMQKYQKDIMAFVRSLPAEEQKMIMQRFQSMRSKEEMMEFGRELFERARAEGFIKIEEEE